MACSTMEWLQELVQSQNPCICHSTAGGSKGVTAKQGGASASILGCPLTMVSLFKLVEAKDMRIYTLEKVLPDRGKHAR